jgi:hypothetical protein
LSRNENGMALYLTFQAALRMRKRTARAVVSS